MSETQTVDTPRPARKKQLNLALLVALAALGLSGYQLYSTQQELAAARQELAGRMAEGNGASKELRGLTEQALSAARATDAKLAVLETRVNESAGQYNTLNGMYQELTKNRSDWLLSEVEHTLAIASQQLQLAGNVTAAISALQMVDARLSKFDQPQLIAVKKAVATDLEKLKALPVLDSVGLTVKLDRLMLSSSMPLVVDAHHLQDKQTTKRVADTAPSGNVWWPTSARAWASWCTSAAWTSRKPCCCRRSNPSSCART
jgi:uroporphyrin-3 C-methyltransferase